MLLLLSALAQGAPTTDTIDVTDESPFADDERCFTDGRTSMTSLEAEAVYEFTLTTEEIGNLEDIDIRLRAYRQNCRVEIDEFEIYLDSTSLYKDATIGLFTIGDGSAESPDWRLDRTFTVSDIDDEIVTGGTHEFRAVARGAGDNENTKIEITITANWKHGSDWDSDTYADDRLTGGDDCNDDDPAINPGATEIWYDGTDQDCDQWPDYDQDFDGFDSAADSALGTDCDDLDDEINPDADETWYDGVDQDCDGRSDYDQDLDGHDIIRDAGDGQDCNDEDPDINPDADEIWYDGVDQDCDEWSDYDQDFDGHDIIRDAGDGQDCDDEDPDINPEATEIWYDGVDQDCDGWSDYDQDRDGYDSPDHGGDDCDDEDASAFPGARQWSEDCERAVKNDNTRTAPAPPEAVGSGCSCNSTSGASSVAWLGLAGLALVLRRRRRRV